MVDLDNIRNFTTDKPPGWTLFGTPREFEELPPTHRAQIRFLNKEAIDYIYQFSGRSFNLVSGDLWDPFAKGNFRAVEKFYDFTNFKESWQHLKKWLYQRGIPFSTWVFVLPNGICGPMLTTWKMVVRYSRDLFLIDDVMVFDRTLNWCLFFFHENELFFGKDPAGYDPAEDLKRMEALNERKRKYPQFKHPYL